MLLQRIKLNGFLGHYGAANGNGADIKPVEVDFTSSNLWLIHGANGCGKSSLWDAILFAFFKQNRTGKTHHDNLIHDYADKANIWIEFELNDSCYQLCCTLKKRGNRKVARLLQIKDGSEWKTCVDGTTNDDEIGQWIGKNLQMSAETFTSAVLLQQGKADKFFDPAFASKRKEVLLQLLQLGFYRELGKKADDKRKDEKRRSDDCESELVGLRNPSAEEISAQEKAIETINKLFAENKAKLEAKAAELSDAQKAADYQAQIAKIKVEQDADENLFTERERIAANVRLFRELQCDLPLLDDFWIASEGYERTQNEANNTSRNVKKLQTELAEIVENLAVTQSAKDEAKEKLQTAQTVLSEAEKQQNETQEKLVSIEQCEKIEAEITAKEKELTPHQAILHRRGEIAESFRVYENLHDKLPLLRELKNAATDLKTAETNLTIAENKVANLQKQFEESEKQTATLQATLTAKTGERQPAQEEISEIEKQFGILRDRLAKRDKISGADVCNYCGSDLNSAKARERLAQEHASWQTELENAENQKMRLTQILQQSANEENSIREGVKIAAKQTENFKNDLITAKTSLEYCTNEVAKAKQDFECRYKATGDAAGETENLADLESQFAILQTARADNDSLQTALQCENGINTSISEKKAQLANFGAFSSDEREIIKSAVQIIEKTVRENWQMKDDAQTDFDRLKKAVDYLEKEQVQVDAKLEAEKGVFANADQRRGEAKTRLDEKRAAIPEQRSDTCEDRVNFEELKRQKQALSNAEDEFEKLLQAEGRKSELRGQYQIIFDLLSKIPEMRRREVGVVENELAYLKIASERQTIEQRISENLLSDLQRQQRAYVEKSVKFDAAAREFELSKKLADALGKGGLQAQIAQDAQERIKYAANVILNRLSSGRFQIDLKSVSETELEIRVSDGFTGETRLFEYFSGGEKFCVAISLALAIGQNASGGRTARTIVIDEGFGALDEKNRVSLVKELSLLSEEINGRVITVSHQEDVCESFTHRYKLIRTERGFVAVEPSFI